MRPSSSHSGSPRRVGLPWTTHRHGYRTLEYLPLWASWLRSHVAKLTSSGLDDLGCDLQKAWLKALFANSCSLPTEYSNLSKHLFQRLWRSSIAEQGAKSCQTLVLSSNQVTGCLRGARRLVLRRLSSSLLRFSGLLCEGCSSST
jgi:hypothetical protein